MAIYRTGQASMDAQGYVTGYDTKWREQLSLIRPGATIFFIDAPFQAAVISEVISDTQIRAITTGGAEIGRSNYIILLHDSITVDGLAQDVAETLRYYQSKETKIEEAIEFFKNFDLKTLQDLVNQVKGDAEKTAADRAATEQLKNNTQQIKDSAVAETNQIKADTDAIKAQTQQIKDSAITETEAIKQEAFGARAQAELARDAAGNHAVNANNAKSGAETARDEARQWAQQVQPENLLHKDQNLNDLADKVAARNNFGIGENDIPVFKGVHLIEKNGGNSGLVYLSNRDANGNDVSNSRIYNEIQGGLSKTIIHTFRPGGGNSYLQIDERGYVSNFSSLGVGLQDHLLGANAIAIGDNDTGFKWGGDGILQVHCNGRMIAAYQSHDVNMHGLLTMWPTSDNSSGIRVAGARSGGANAMIGGQVAAGGWDGWRDRACGMLVELPSDDAAANVFKVVRWGGDWVAGLDVVRYSAGGCEAHFNVKGAVYGFNDAGYASAVQWVNTSDIRLKANLKEIENAKEKVKSIKGYTYFKRNNLDEDEYSIYSEEAGVIAQDVQSVLPEAVYKVSDSEYLGVSYGGVTALLVNAFNEMSDQVDKQQEEIERLKSEIADLKAAVAALLNKPTTLKG